MSTQLITDVSLPEVKVENISNPIQQNEKRDCRSTTTATDSLNPAPSTSKLNEEQIAKQERSEQAISNLNGGTNHKETSEQISTNNTKGKSAQSPPLEIAGSPISEFKRKKLRVLSSSSSEEDEPILIKSKNRRLNKKEKKIAKTTKASDKRTKPCKILAHRLSVPDHYTFGAQLKKHYSKNSRHPYTIKKWLKLNKNTKLSKGVNKTKNQKKTSEHQLLLNEGVSVLLLDALKTPTDNGQEHDVIKKVRQNETGGKFIYLSGRGVKW